MMSTHIHICFCVYIHIKRIHIDLIVGGHLYHFYHFCNSHFFDREVTGHFSFLSLQAVCLSAHLSGAGSHLLLCLL